MGLVPAVFYCRKLYLHCNRLIKLEPTATFSLSETVDGKSSYSELHEKSWHMAFGKLIKPAQKFCFIMYFSCQLMDKSDMFCFDSQPFL